MASGKGLDFGGRGHQSFGGLRGTLPENGTFLESCAGVSSSTFQSLPPWKREGHGCTQLGSGAGSLPNHPRTGRTAGTQAPMGPSLGLLPHTIK